MYFVLELTCVVVCVLLCTRYGLLQQFSTYFRKLKEIGVYGLYIQTIFISCDYGKCDQVCSFMRIWSHLIKKFLTENFIFMLHYLMLHYFIIALFHVPLFSCCTN